MHKKRMSIYDELDPILKQRTQFAFKGKRDHIAMLNLTNIAYPNQHIDIEITHGSRDHVIVLNTVTWKLFLLSFSKQNR